MRLPSYRKHVSKSADGTVTVRARVTLSGKDFLLGEYGSKQSRQKYNRLLAEWLVSNQSTTFGVPAKDLLMVELLTAYLKSMKKYYGDGPESEFRRIKPAVSAMRSLYGSEPAHAFGPMQFKAVREHIALTGDRSRQYVNKLCDKIKRMFRWAASESLVPSSIAESLSMVDSLKEGRTDLREAEEIEPVEVEVVDGTLFHLPSIVADMVRFQLATGCRPGQVCSIKPEMVDRSSDVWTIKLKEHKNKWRGKTRTIYVRREAQDILLPYLLRANDAFCFSPKDSEKARRLALNEARTTPESCGNSPGTNRKSKPKRTAGDRYTTGSYGKAILRACDKAYPLPDKLSGEETKAWIDRHRWSPNQLRHTFATVMSREHGIVVTSILLGHSKVDTTQIYAQEDREKAIAVTRAMG